jgi:hypothetical protein
MLQILKRVLFLAVIGLVLIGVNNFSMGEAQTTLTCSRGVGLFANLDANASVNYGVFNRRGFLELRYTNINSTWTTLTGITAALGLRDAGASARRYERNTKLDIYGWGTVDSYIPTPIGFVVFHSELYDVSCTH